MFDGCGAVACCSYGESGESGIGGSGIARLINARAGQGATGASDISLSICTSDLGCGGSDMLKLFVSNGKEWQICIETRRLRVIL